MNNIIKILCLLLACCLLGSWLYIIQLNNKITKFQTTNIVIQQEESEIVSGGLELPLKETTLGFNTVFPIDSEDYKQFTSPFGLRISPFLKKEVKHNGLDIQAVWNAQVVSIANGKVIDHYPPPGTPHPGGGYYKGHPIYGGMIKIQHEGYVSLYAHLGWSRVKIGQTIKAGDVIGRVGNTGKSTGPHLHIEILINEVPVNPLLYIPVP